MRLDGRVVVGEKGGVKGEIDGRSVLVAGRVEGPVRGSERVEVGGTGRLEGDISAPRVTIAEGAFFKGKVEMGGQDERRKPAEKPTAPERGGSPAPGSRPGPAALAVPATPAERAARDRASPMTRRPRARCRPGRVGQAGQAVRTGRRRLRGRRRAGRPSVKIGIPREIKDHEYRIGMIPASVHALVEAGHEVVVEAGAGQGSGFEDDEFREAGGTILETPTRSGRPRR